MASVYLVFREGDSDSTDELLRAFYDERDANAYAGAMLDEAQLFREAQQLRSRYMDEWWSNGLSKYSKLDVAEYKAGITKMEQAYKEEDRRFVMTNHTLNATQKEKLLKLGWRACQQCYVKAVEVE